MFFLTVLANRSLLDIEIKIENQTLFGDGSRTAPPWMLQQSQIRLCCHLIAALKIEVSKENFWKVLQFGSPEKLSLRPYHEQFCRESLTRKYLTTFFDPFHATGALRTLENLCIFMFSGAIERNQCHEMDWSDKKEAKIRT